MSSTSAYDQYILLLKQKEERNRLFALATGSEEKILDVLTKDKKIDDGEKKQNQILGLQIWDDLEKTMTDVLNESGSGMLPELIQLSMTFI